MKATGDVTIDPQYLVHEQDLFDAVRGVGTMIQGINGDSYKCVNYAFWFLVLKTRRMVQQRGLPILSRSREEISKTFS